VGQSGLDRGRPLSFNAPALTAPLPDAIGLAEALDVAFPDRSGDEGYKVVGGLVDGTPYYAVYNVEEDASIFWAEVIDGDGLEVADTDLIKRGGAWRWVGRVKTAGELTLGGFFVVALVLYGWLYYRQPRPGAPRRVKVESWRSDRTLLTLAAIPVIGWIALGVLPGVSGARKRRALMKAGFGWIGVLVLLVWFDDSTKLDALGAFVLVMLTLAFVWSVAGGRLALAPAGFGRPEDEAATGHQEDAAGRSGPRRSRRRHRRRIGRRSQGAVPAGRAPRPGPVPAGGPEDPGGDGPGLRRGPRRPRGVGHGHGRRSARLMPCMFCVAVGFALAGAVGAAAVDLLTRRLESRASGPERKVAESESVAKVELDVEAAGKQVPVAVTLFKDSGRVRIQLLNHELGRPEAEKLQNEIADLLDIRIVERSDPEDEAKVREAAAELATRPATPGAAPPSQPLRARRRWPFGR
jgi:hypothetical protein